MLNYRTGLMYFNLKKYLSNKIDAPHTKILEKVPAGPVVKLDPAVIPKYVNQLEKPPAYQPFLIINRNKKHKKKKKGKTSKPSLKSEKSNGKTYINKRKNRKMKCRKGKHKKIQVKHFYMVDISEFKQQILPEGFPKTKVWGYGGLVKDPKTGRIRYHRSTPGPTFEAIRGIPVKVKWINRLKGKHLFAVDPTLHWANPNHMPMHPPMPWPDYPPGFKEAQKPVPTVTHLHGGEVGSESDGHPDAWFTYDKKKGPGFETSLYTYPNEQEAATLWYHDHALGLTRLNVHAGLAGFYLLRDKGKSDHTSYYQEGKLKLPSGKYEIPLVIQDRMFNTDGSMAFPSEGADPEVHPYWIPDMLGDTIMVNGKIWPNLDVQRRQYRFRVLNGSNSRFYNLKFSNGMKFIQIGSDGGFLPKPVEITSLLLAPAERADILVNYSDINPGTSVLLLNDANAPYPIGDAPDPDTVGQIMQFSVPLNACKIEHPDSLPAKLNHMPKLKPDSPRRILTTNAVIGPNGPTMILLNGQKWEANTSETPRVGSTEEWCIVNLAPVSHPIHLHLIQFQILNRQSFNAAEYGTKWTEVNGTPPLNQPTVEIPIEPYLTGDPVEPDVNEKGWKDTVRLEPGMITRIRVRFAPQDIPSCYSKPGKNYFPFDPHTGPGYVWHCHILDHEDNEMMRPMKIKS